MHQRFAAPLVTAFLATSFLTGQDTWPEYRGPGRDGHAPQANVPLEWSEKENVRWKTKIHGTGWSSPVARDGRIWLTTATRDGSKMSVIAIDASSGDVLFDRVLFENPAPQDKNKLNSYASPSPTIEKGRVYVHFGTYGTACLDTGTGATVWERRDIRCDHIVGPGSSPILHRDLLIFHMDGGDAQYVIALDKETGKTRWRTNRSVDWRGAMPDLRKAYSTPLIVKIDGKERLLSSGAKATAAYDSATGEELWSVRHPGFSMSSRPVVHEDKVILNTGFMSARLIAVKLAGTGDVTDTNIAWTCRRSVPRMASPVLVDGLLYMVSDDGILSCLDATTGERVWRTRLDANHCASPVYAGGRIYLFDREGTSIVIKPGRKFEKLAENRLEHGFMASAAVVGDAFILRTRQHLYRIEAAASSATPKRGGIGGWPRFRGPNGTGVADAGSLPTEFGLGADGKRKNLVWRTPLPPGHSSPVLSKTHVFLTGVEGEKIFTYCIDQKTGAIAWRRAAPRPRRAKFDKRNNAASPTPAVDADTVVVFFEEFGLLAYDLAGQKRWEVPLGPFANEYGMGASPVIFADRVFLACDHQKGSFLLAVAKKDGAELFRIPRPEAKSGHCTPIVYQPEGKTPQLILPGSFLLDAYDTQTGEKVWWVRGLSFEMKSTPVLHDDIIYINGYGSPLNQPGSIIELPDFPATLTQHDANGDGAIEKKEMPKFRGAGMFFGFVDLGKDGKLDSKDWAFLRASLSSRNGMLAVRAGGRGDMTKQSVLWTYHRSVPQLPSPLLAGGVVYLVLDQGGIVVRLDPKTGAVVGRGRLKEAIDNYYASPVAGDGKVYLLSEGGTLSTLREGGDLEPLAVSELEEDCYATPAIRDGRLFVRTDRALYCFGDRGEASLNIQPQRDHPAPRIGEGIRQLQAPYEHQPPSSPDDLGSAVRTAALEIRTGK